MGSTFSSLMPSVGLIFFFRSFGKQRPLWREYSDNDDFVVPHPVYVRAFYGITSTVLLLSHWWVAFSHLPVAHWPAVVPITLINS